MDRAVSAKISLAFYSQIGYNTVTKQKQRVTNRFRRYNFMGKRSLCAALCLAVLFSFCSQSNAAELQQKNTSSQQAIQLEVNGVALDSVLIDTTYDTIYADYGPILFALYPDAVATWQNAAVIRASGLEVRLQPGLSYIIANGRYLYLGSRVVYTDENGAIMVPLRLFCSILGADVALEGSTIVITSTGKGPIQSGDSYYDPDTLYWLSHIIYAESGNQPLAGKIAVGNVVLNRVADSRFPNTVYDVVFQHKQFTPVSNGTIYLEPNAESVIAAKLCLDGANTVGNSLYFVNPRVSPNCWAIRNRPHVATIGAHAFFA